MKTPKLLLASLLLATTAIMAFAGPSPQFQQQMGAARKNTTPAPAAKTSEQSGVCAQCSCAAMAKK